MKKGALSWLLIPVIGIFGPIILLCMNLEDIDKHHCKQGLNAILSLVLYEIAIVLYIIAITFMGLYQLNLLAILALLALVVWFFVILIKGFIHANDGMYFKGLGVLQILK